MSNFNHEAYERAAARRDLARTDLDELSQQVEDGEIDEATAAELRAGYESELAAAEADLAKLGTPPTAKKPKAEKEAPAAAASKGRAPSEQGQTAGSGGLNSRILVGAGILIVAFIVILLSVQNSSEPEPTAGAPMGTAADGTDPCAELAAALETHEDNGFRLALADCYTQTGNAMSAIEHFRFVAESGDATDLEAAQANVGLGYLNLQIGEVQSAADYMAVALEHDADNIEARYFLGMILIYDLGDPAGGVSYLESVLETPDLPATVVTDIETAIAEATGASS